MMRLIGSLCRCICMIPVLLFSFVGALLVICGFNKCLCFRLRDRSFIRKFLLILGYDKFPEVSLTAIVHDATGIEPGKNLTVILSACASGGTKNNFETRKSKDYKWEEPMEITIEQGTVYVDVCIMNGKQTMAKTGVPLTDIWELSDQSDPKMKCTLRKTLSSGLKINPGLAISWCFPDNENLPLLFGYGLATADNVTKKAIDINELASYCAGWLQKTHNFGLTHLRYFEMLKHEGKWHWCWYETQDHKTTPIDQKLAKNLEALRVVSISPVPEDNETFVVRYQDDNKEAVNLVLKNVDGKSREAWVEALRVFSSTLKDQSRSKDEKKKKSRKDRKKAKGDGSNTNAMEEV